MKFIFEHEGAIILFHEVPNHFIIYPERGDKIKIAENMYYVESVYWDLDDNSIRVIICHV